MQGKRIRMITLGLVIFITFILLGVTIAQEGKKIEGDVGWVTLDKKTLTLVREGKHLADIGLGPEVVVKIMEEQKADKGEKKSKSGKKDKAAKKDTEAKAEPAAEVKKDGEGKEEPAKEGKKEAAAPAVQTICYTIKPGNVNDILSGWKASVTYTEQGKKKMAREITVTPIVFGGDDED